MSEDLPRLVTGTVTRHEGYGFFVDLADEREGITMISDDPEQTEPEFPEVGRTIEVVLLGYTAIGRQPRLSVRPSDRAEAREPH